MAPVGPLELVFFRALGGPSSALRSFHSYPGHPGGESGKRFFFILKTPYR